MGSEQYDPNRKDTEYQYSEEHISNDYTEAQAPIEEVPAKKNNIFAKLLNKKVIIVLVILIAIFVVYKFVTPTVTPTDDKDLLQQQLTAADTSGQQASVVAPTPVDSSPVKQVDLLTQQTGQDESQIKDLQSNVQRLNSTAVQLQNSFASLNDRVRNLADQVQRLATEKAQPIIVKSKPVVKKSSTIAPPVYYLKAVVPGRAWLQSSDGKLLTVKVGDKLSGYGIIKAIDTTQGWVGTSSGTVIQYGPQDS